MKNIDEAVISVHCHDDLGLAVANSLAAVKAGARQVEGTFNGIGERAGNCALEEVVMAIKTRGEYFAGLQTGIITREILKTSRIISRMSGLHVARSKAIVGENAFAHSAGIHQDGILKKRETYEIMDPEEVGWGGTELPLTKHSGRHAMVARLEHLGFKLTNAEIASVFERFKDVGDKKKFVYDDDLSALVEDSMSAGNRNLHLGLHPRHQRLDHGSHCHGKTETRLGDAAGFESWQWRGGRRDAGSRPHRKTPGTSGRIQCRGRDTGEGLAGRGDPKG